jgi:uncharacterized phage protein gp47/JayE
MAFPQPTTKEQFEINLANFENKLNQESPLNDKAFLRVLAAVQAGQGTGIYKSAADLALGVLAITATGEALDIIGNNYGVPRKAAEAAQFIIDLPAVDSTVIPITVDFVGDSNGLRYSVDASAIASGGSATINVTAKTTGSDGNLNVSETMTIGRTIPGAESVATITTITNTGVNRESDEDYRPRVLDAIRTAPGGGNSADYRLWAQEVAGVARAYPFAGQPVGSGLESVPPDRVVYIEATTDIDPDGLAPQSLLDEVRAAITADPDTGITRQPLGLTDDTLYVESIVRTTFFVTISELSVDPNVEAQVKADIDTALTTYFRSVRPYVDGLDSPNDRSDTMTDASVSEIINGVVRGAGGSVSGIAFDVTPGTSIPKYQLNANETAKLGGITYS